MSFADKWEECDFRIGNSRMVAGEVQPQETWDFSLPVYRQIQQHVQGAGDAVIGTYDIDFPAFSQTIESTSAAPQDKLQLLTARRNFAIEFFGENFQCFAFAYVLLDSRSICRKRQRQDLKGGYA